MNDDEIKLQFRKDVGRHIANPTTTKVPLPKNFKPRELQRIDTANQPKPPSRFKVLINTKGGSLICLLIFAVLLALGQTNSATPFKFVLFRNVMIAIGINWWRFRHEQKNDELFP